MKKTLLYILLIFLLYSVNISAQYQTNTWFCGYLEPGNTDRDSIVRLQLKNHKSLISYVDSPHSFESTFASISDSLGKLLLYTNGCMIADSSNQIISNGDGLNPGLMANELCGQYGYISEMGAVFIPVPNHKNDFWLIHLGVERDTLLKVKYGPLYASYIDGSNGKYSVTTKNQVLLTGDLERFAVVKHGNGRDWWIVLPKYSSNSYYSFLISPTGIEEKGVQETGPVFHYKYCSNGRGSNAFSNLGKYYVRYNISCGPVIFDFDRCTGLLDDPVYFTPIDKQVGGGGVAFNTEDTKLYYSTQNRIYKIDFQNFPLASQVLIPGVSTYGSTLGEMFMGSDSIIYINSQSSSFNIHKLYPDFITVKEDSFKINALVLPVRNTRTIPYYLNYRLGSLSTSNCDSLITSTSNNQNKSLTIYPNPAQNHIKIDLKDLDFKGDMLLKMFNSIGELVYKEGINKQQTEVTINLKGFKVGFYIINVVDRSDTYTMKLIIQ